MKIIYSLLAVLIAIVAYIIFSSPSSMVISKSGNIDSLINNIRMRVQGKTFWEKQLKIINNDIDFWVNLPNETASIDRETEQSIYTACIESETNRTQCEAERRARLLRNQADKIEHFQDDREFERERIQTINDYKAIKTIIETKIKDY